MEKARKLEYLESICPPGVKDRSYDALVTWLFGSDERTLAVCEKPASSYVRRMIMKGTRLMPEQDKQAWREDVKKLIIDYINDSFAFNLHSWKVFDAWHRLTCEDICERSNKHGVSKWVDWMENGFPYGLAQIWLNLTIKNMLLMERWDEKIAPAEKHLHVPADSVIVEAASKDFGISVNGSKPWKQWDGNEYFQFQEELRKVVDCPIDWAFGVEIKKNKDSKGGGEI